MSKPLTMTMERESDLRTVYVEGPYEDKLSHTETWAEVDALRAALAAAEAKLADSERACAGFVKMAADEMYRADAMAHALDQSPYMRARVKAQYVAARRAAEVK